MGDGHSTPGYLPILRGASEKVQYLTLGSAGGGLTNFDAFCDETILPSLKHLSLLNFEGIPMVLYEKFLVLNNMSFNTFSAKFPKTQE